MEINTHVNYPIKASLVRMVERGEIDMECPVQKYFVSWLTIRVCCVGSRLAVDAWNNHPVPGIIIAVYYNCYITSV